MELPIFLDDGGNLPQCAPNDRQKTAGGVSIFRTKAGLHSVCKIKYGIQYTDQETQKNNNFTNSEIPTKSRKKLFPPTKAHVCRR